MINFRKWIKKWYPLILEATIVVSCSIIIIQSEKFQEKLSPKKYWASKVKELEGDLKIERWKVRSLELSLEREKVSGQYTIQAAIDHARSFGKDVESVAQSAMIEYEEKLNTLQKDLESSKKMLASHKNKLEKAQVKLEKIRS